MSEDDTTQTPINQNEALERYRIRFGLYKVVLGTMLVGLVGILIPAAIEYWKLYFEDNRKQMELRYAQETLQREYVKEFLDTALSQDIELRIRFAQYFSDLSPGTPENPSGWRTYRDALIEAREAGRQQIRKDSTALEMLLRGRDRSTATEVEILRLRREIDWVYAELGYVQPDRSVLPTQVEREREDKLSGAKMASLPSIGAAGHIISIGGKNACLQKKLNNYDNGNPIHVWDCGSGSDANKTWIYEPLTGLIRNAVNRETCLHKREGGWRNGNPIHLWACDRGSAEYKTWLYDAKTSQIRARANPGSCMHKQFPGWENGNPVHLWRCFNPPNENEKWRVTLSANDQ